jgi:hypothetical protein
MSVPGGPKLYKSPAPLDTPALPGHGHSPLGLGLELAAGVSSGSVGIAWATGHSSSPLDWALGLLW